MPADPDEDTLQYTFDGEDGRSTTSILLNSGITGFVNPWAKSADALDNEVVTGDDTLTTAVRSGGMPSWAWVIIIVAAALVVRRAGLFLLGSLADRRGLT
jgi:hypothetical protein